MRIGHRTDPKANSNGDDLARPDRDPTTTHFRGVDPTAARSPAPTVHGKENGSQQIINTGTATGDDGHGGTPSDTDDAHHKDLHLPSSIVKSGPAFGHDGEDLTFTYKVTNTGDTPLSDVTVTDDKCASVTGPTARPTERSRRKIRIGRVVPQVRDAHRVVVRPVGHLDGRHRRGAAGEHGGVAGPIDGRRDR